MTSKETAACYSMALFSYTGLVRLCSPRLTYYPFICRLYTVNGRLLHNRSIIFGNGANIIMIFYLRMSKSISAVQVSKQLSL